MSKIGKQPIKIPEGVEVKIGKDSIEISGKSGLKLNVAALSGVRPIEKEGEICFELIGQNKQSRSNWGTLRSLVKNAIEASVASTSPIDGVVQGFEKTLLLVGVGYKIKEEGENLVLSLGFSHPVYYNKPEGINFEVSGKGNVLKIKGIDKALVGQVAAEIRGLKKVEPYKGKGFRYKDEVVRRKAGKKAAAEA